LQFSAFIQCQGLTIKAPNDSAQHYCALYWTCPRSLPGNLLRQRSNSSSPHYRPLCNLT